MGVVSCACYCFVEAAADAARESSLFAFRLSPFVRRIFPTTPFPKFGHFRPQARPIVMRRHHKMRRYYEGQIRLFSTPPNAMMMNGLGPSRRVRERGSAQIGRAHV